MPSQSPWPSMYTNSRVTQACLKKQSDGRNCYPSRPHSPGSWILRPRPHFGQQRRPIAGYHNTRENNKSKLSHPPTSASNLGFRGKDQAVKTLSDIWHPSRYSLRLPPLRLERRQHAKAMALSLARSQGRGNGELSQCSQTLISTFSS